MTEKSKNTVTVCVMAVLLLGISLVCWLKDNTPYSESERRVLKSFPDLTFETVVSGDFMEEFETYTLDQFPLRDRFRTIKSASSLYAFGKLDNNDIYITDGHISKLEYPLKKAMLNHASERFRYLYDTYIADTNSNVYLSIIPDKNYFLAEENGYLSLDYEYLISYIREKNNYMEYIDITETLCLEDYYRTDTHWRQEKLLDTAQKLANGLGVELSSDYRVNTLDNPFYGVYCGQLALPISPDQINYLTSDTLDNCIVTSYDTGKPVQKWVYDMEKSYGKDPYEMFLSGSDALITLENPNAKAKKELIIFRDSFGSSITPFLAEAYSKITLIDIRYIRSDLLEDMVDFNNCDVLFLYSTMLLNNSLALR